MRVIAPGIFFTALLVLGSGCQVSGPPTGPNAVTLQIPDREAFLDATLTLLRKHDFPPERVDRTAGLIVTRPSTGKQWFEFWRQDSQGAYQVFESSIHTIRRTITIRLEPTAETPDTHRLSVAVEKERYSAPERQITTASGALAIYSERLPTTEGLLAARTAGEHWVPLGRDGRFERYLLERIGRLAGAEQVGAPAP